MKKEKTYGNIYFMFCSRIILYSGLVTDVIKFERNTPGVHQCHSPNILPLV